MMRAVTASLPSRHDASSAAPTAFRLGSVEVHVARREIVSGGAARQLEPRAFDLLAYLIEHRGRVVTKNELLDVVWRRSAVSDSVVARTVMKARAAIGDACPNGPAIRTVHRVGYRFVAPIEPLGAEPAAPAAAVRLAILPFEDRTGRAEFRWVGLGLMSQLAAALSASPRIGLASAAAVLAALDAGAGSGPDRALREVLGTDAIVRSTVEFGAAGFVLRCRVESDDGIAALSAASTDSALEAVPTLAAALEHLFDPHAESAVRRYRDPFAAELHARVRQAQGEQHWDLAVPLLQALVEIEPGCMQAPLELREALARQHQEARVLAVPGPLSLQGQHRIPASPG